MDKIWEYLEIVITKIVEYGPKFLGALIVLFLGLWTIKIIKKRLDKILSIRKVDENLRPFLKSLTVILLRVLLFISVLSIAGVEMTSFIAILGAAGLAVGMALSGTLQNFAGGVMLLIFKPYKVGDYIEAQGYSGTVSEILIFNTILKTPDNKTIIIPNGGISTGSMINYSTQKERRIEWIFGIAYGDSYELAKQTLMDLIAEEDRTLPDPEPFIALKELADSSVNITVRVWVKAEHYWPVFFSMNEKVYKIFSEKGINIPFPQMDVHISKQ
ncbi:MAG: mechanosensitive ion channel protein MscS [Marinilabiliales bacterium]|nr:MAG: mechanosensitive ion channel protein MscS [Marinilabiliales bacterium]